MSSTVSIAGSLPVPVVAPLGNPAPSRTLPPARSGYIPTLDGWRAIAILLVLFDHVGDSLNALLPHFGIHLPNALLHRGQMGVYIFFGLSGYLITSRLLSEAQETGRISLRDFYIRRFFRVLPPMWLYLLVAAILAGLSLIPIYGSQWWSAATFIANYNSNRGWYVGHFWSLAVEEHFYLLWPATLVLVGKHMALKIALAVAVSMPAWRHIVTTTGITGFTPNLYSRTDLVLDTLLLGGAAALLMTYPRFREFINRLPRVAPWLLAAGVILATIFRSDLWRMPQSALLVMLMLYTVTHARSLPGRLLENAVLRWIGRLSYSMYIWQQLFMVFAGWEAPALYPLQTFPLNVLATFACASVSYYLVEKPFVSWGQRITRRNPHIAVPSPALVPH